MKASTGRGTSHCEVSHRDMNTLLGNGVVSIARALRVMWTYYEISNEAKLVSRQGLTQQLTHRTEELYLRNTMALDCNLPLPYPEVSAPPTPPVQEFMGLCSRLPLAFSLGNWLTG